MRANMIVSPDETSCGAPRRPGRGGRIRTGDLEYPKLPRYQAALRPARRGGRPIRPGVDYTLLIEPASKAVAAQRPPNQGWATRSPGAIPSLRAVPAMTSSTPRAGT